MPYKRPDTQIIDLIKKIEQIIRENEGELAARDFCLIVDYTTFKRTVRKEKGIYFGEKFPLLEKVRQIRSKLK